MSETSASSSIGKWLAGIAAAVIGAVIVWWLTQSGGLLDPDRPTPSIPSPPHAPPIGDDFGVPLYDEQLLVLTVGPGEKVPLSVMDLWSAPEGAQPSCADGFLAFTWMVRMPYPEGGQDLEILRAIPRGGGRTELLARGATGSATAGYCGELTVFNTGLSEYQVEIRYASGVV